jgi:hypothetical protein
MTVSHILTSASTSALASGECELVASKDMSKEADEYPLLESMTKKQVCEDTVN